MVKFPIYPCSSMRCHVRVTHHGWSSIDNLSCIWCYAFHCSLTCFAFHYLSMTVVGCECQQILYDKAYICMVFYTVLIFVTTLGDFRTYASYTIPNP